MNKITVRKPREGELEELDVFSWPIWTCGVSRFDWQYNEIETCYILEGKVTVSGGGQTVNFGPGDLVIFPQGLDCVWDVTQAVKKHYKFG